MTEPAFRGTLLLLQNRTRRDPEAYRDEFLAQLDHFKALSKTIMTQQQTSNPQYIAVLNYVCHVGHCFPAECAEVVDIVVQLLQEFKGAAMSSELRLALVKCLALMRSKNIVSAERSFPLLFQLLQERDKNLRRLILSHVVSDIRKVNMPGAKNGAQVNKKAQNFLFSVMADDDPVQARCAEMVMIDLYRRRVWANERTVEVLTQACFSRHTPILRTALRFFLLQMPKIASLDDGNGDEEETDPGRSISRMKQKLKIVKKTSKRQRILKRDMNAVKRKYNKEEKEEELFAKQHVDPVRLLRDPQQFVERLLARLQKTTERFEVRILFLNVIARVVSEHEVVHLPLYGFLERYMEPSQLHATQLLALSVMCVHRMIPPDTLEPIVKAIANHFVSDRASPDAITVGLNTIREICKRQPLAMNADLLKDLIEYKSQRGDRGVMMAARALIQLFRDVYPDLLPAKLRGGRAGPAEEKECPVYGKQEVYTDVPGLELLYADDMDNKNSGKDNTSCSSDDDDDDNDDDSDGTWITDSSECDPDDVDGSFVDVSDSDSDAASDTCPQLVQVQGAIPNTASIDTASAAEGMEEEPPLKRTRGEDDTKSDVLSVGTVLDDEDDNDNVCHSRGSIVVLDASVPYESTNEEAEEKEEEGEEMEEEGEEEEESEEEESEEGEEEENDDWFEDADANSTRPSIRSTSSTAVAAASDGGNSTKVSAAAMRILTDEDFQRIRRLQAQNGSHRSLRGKHKAREAREKRRQQLIHGISADLSAHDIEHFTEKKRAEDKEEKIARAQELRQASSKFEARKKKKSKLNSTHLEHAKRGKLFSMAKRSHRVGAKLKSSVSDRSSRKKENKKKDIKFRIRRGWKA
ncbi:putative domain NUC130/133 [Trypanosoma melophagium]|uniref:putative domain NUC130/133 n=1 Tax=Trypanosoma melophagium TaxID=715481 RepID=UPI003519E062|nr:putative domain NUC130/133 [Trypanosoma melophagium]